MCDPVSAQNLEYAIPRPKGGMSLREIVAADNAKNYAGEDVSVDAAYSKLQELVQSGEKLYRAGNTVFVTKKVSPTAIEFHTVNGEPGSRLVKNVQDYMGQLSAKGITDVVTYYDNPKINDLWPLTKLNATVTKVNQGQDRTFEAKVSL